MNLWLDGWWIAGRKNLWMDDWIYEMISEWTVDHELMNTGSMNLRDYRLMEILVYKIGNLLVYKIGNLLINEIGI